MAVAKVNFDIPLPQGYAPVVLVGDPFAPEPGLLEDYAKLLARHYDRRMHGLRLRNFLPLPPRSIERYFQHRIGEILQFHDLSAVYRDAVEGDVVISRIFNARGALDRFHRAHRDISHVLAPTYHELTYHLPFVLE